MPRTFDARAGSSFIPWSRLNDSRYQPFGLGLSGVVRSVPNLPALAPGRAAAAGVLKLKARLRKGGPQGGTLRLDADGWDLPVGLVRSKTAQPQALRQPHAGTH